MTSRPHRRRSVALAVFGVLLGLLVVPTTALGHAALVSVTPADTSTVQGSPTEIAMTFAQNLDPAKSSIRLVDAAGAVIVEGGTVPAGKPREMDLVLSTALAPGTYTIRWTTFSTEDGETARGTTTFTVVAEASTPPSPTPATSEAVPSGARTPSANPTAAVSPSAPPTSPATTSTGDVVIPIVGAIVVLGAIGLWLLRGRSRTGAR